MIKFLDVILSSLNVGAGFKTKIAAVAALVLAVIAAWNSAAPELGLVEYAINLPEWLNAAVLALLGVGAVHHPVNALKAREPSNNG